MPDWGWECGVTDWRGEGQLSDVIEVPSLVSELHLMGPTVLPGLLRRYTLRAVREAVAKGWLMVYEDHALPVYDVGMMGRAILGISNRKTRKAAGLMDSFALRHVIDWHLDQGYTFVELYARRRVALLLTPDGRREHICAKATDYSESGLEELYHRVLNEVMPGSGVLVVMARNEQAAARVIESLKLWYAAPRDFSVTLEGASPALIDMLTRVGVPKTK